MITLSDIVIKDHNDIITFILTDDTKISANLEKLIQIVEVVFDEEPYLYDFANNATFKKVAPATYKVSKSYFDFCVKLSLE